MASVRDRTTDLAREELAAAGVRAPRGRGRFWLGLGLGVSITALLGAIVLIGVAGELFGAFVAGLHGFIDALWGH